MMKKMTSLRRCEDGSAMTEFVMVLPVFIMIFSGMGSLYRIHQDVLEEKAERNAAFWEKAEMGGGFEIPLLAGIQSVGSFTDLAQNGGQALGIYMDSGLKSTLPLVIPGTTPESPCYTVGCALGGAGDDYFAYDLLNDNSADAVFNGGGLSADGWANVLASGLDILGSRPAFAAGVRYGEVHETAEDRSVSTVWGDYTYNVGKLDVPGITQPTHRSFAVALTRIEFATEDVWNEQIPEFDGSFDTSSASVSGGDECSDAVNAFQACMASGPPEETDDEAAERCESQSPGDACESISGNNPLGGLDGGWCTPGTPGC